MTTENVLFLGIAELRFVSVECQTCQTKVVFDLDSERVAKNAQAGQLPPEECPTCKTKYDSATKALVELRQAYEALKAVSGVRVEVRRRSDA